jgi:hypothetical protein
LTQSSLELVDGHRDRARNVAGGVLARWSRVEHHHVLRAHAFQELAHLHRLGTRPIAELLANETFQVGELVFRDRPDSL